MENFPGYPGLPEKHEAVLSIKSGGVQWRNGKRCCGVNRGGVQWRNGTTWLVIKNIYTYTCTTDNYPTEPAALALIRAGPIRVRL